MTRDRLQNALRRAHGFLANATIDVFEPTESYTAGDGWSVSYPDSPDASYDARIDSPSSTTDRDEGGTTAEIDLIVRVRDDAGQRWTGWGQHTEAAVRIDVDADDLLIESGETYTIPSGEIEVYRSVTVEDGGELVVNGTLVATQTSGDIEVNGEVITSWKRYEVQDVPPTRDGLTRLEVVEV